MRVNVDSAACSDPRMHLLSRHLGINVYEAMGRILRVWFVCYDRRSAVLQSIEVDIAADRDGFADAMVASGLAEHDEHGVYIKGVSERIEFLEKQIEKGKRSGEIRRRNAELRAPAQQGFRFGSSQPGTVVEQRLKRGSTTRRTYSLAPDQDLAPDQAPDHVPRAASDPAPPASSEAPAASDRKPQDAPEPAPARKGPTPADQAYTLAHLLLGLIIENAPNSRLAKQTERQRELTAERWADPIDKLHRLDGMQWGAIEGMIRWCQRDTFWRAVILGGDNLRDKWDTMAGQRNRASPNAPPSSTRKGPTALALEEQQRLEQQEREQEQNA